MSRSWRTRAAAYEPLKAADLGAALRELAAVIDAPVPAPTPAGTEAIDALRVEVADLRGQLAALRDAAPAKAAKAARVKATEGDAST